MGKKKEPTQVTVENLEDSLATTVPVKHYLPKTGKSGGSRKGSRSPLRRSRKDRQQEKLDTVADDLPLSKREMLEMEKLQNQNMDDLAEDIEKLAKDQQDLAG